MKWRLFLRVILNLSPLTLGTMNMMIYLAYRTLNIMAMANGIRDRIVTSLMNTFGQHTHDFNKPPIT